MLAFYRQNDFHWVVNQQIRFVLCDEHWDELKKLRPTGKAGGRGNDAVANVETNVSGWKRSFGS